MFVSPFFLFLVFRCVFPIVWILGYLFNGGMYVEQAAFHLVYLLIQTSLTVSLIVYINSKANYRRRQFSFLSQAESFKYQRSGKYIIFYMLFIIYCLFIIMNYKYLPIFQSGGSDAFTIVNEKHKVLFWVSYSILPFLVVYSIFYGVYHNNSFLSKFLIVLAFTVSLATGKKTALINSVLYYAFAIYCLYDLKKKYIIYLSFLIVLSFIFVLYQFGRTNGFETGALDFFDLVFKNSNSYLIEYFQLNALDFSQEYSESVSFIDYVLNPFLKVLGLGGIDLSIGPYVHQKLYSNMASNGANPTLFFESYFVFGGAVGATLSFLPLIIVFLCIFLCIRKMFSCVCNDIFTFSLNFMLVLNLLFYLVDSLNATRVFPVYAVIGIFAWGYMGIRNHFVRVSCVS